MAEAAIPHQQAVPHERFNWRLPCYAALASSLAILPLAICGFDKGVLLTTAGAGVVGLVILFIAISDHHHRRRSILVALAVYWLASWIILRNGYDVRTLTRWLYDSGDYKAEVLAQPTPPDGQLKHIEWDGWGWAGNDTVIYLVYDPDDSLASAARTHSPGKYTGIPCEVYRVRRLQTHWYTVEYYTDATWNECT